MKQSLLLVFLFCSLAAYSQSSGSIKGKLIDSEYSNDPLAFANVLIKGTNTVSYSDMDGLYTIDNLSPGIYVLEYSFVGYKTHSLTVEVIPGETAKVDVTMHANTPSINKVVFTKTTINENTTALN
jgi:hypothetical protein